MRRFIFPIALCAMIAGTAVLMYRRAQYEQSYEYKVKDWRQYCHVYACPNGTFEGWAFDRRQFNAKDPGEAQSKADAWAEEMAQWDISHKGDANKKAEPCGKEIRL